MSTTPQPALTRGLIFGLSIYQGIKMNQMAIADTRSGEPIKLRSTDTQVAKETAFSIKAFMVISMIILAAWFLTE